MRGIIGLLLCIGVFGQSNYTTIKTMEGNVYISNIEDLSFTMDGQLYYDGPNGQMVTVFKEINHVDAVFRDNGERYYSYHRLNYSSNILNRTHAVFYNLTYDVSVQLRTLFINSEHCTEYKGVSPYLDYVYVSSETGKICRICFETGKCITFRSYGALSEHGKSEIEKYIEQTTSQTIKNTGRQAKILLVIDPNFGGTEDAFTGAKLDLLNSLRDLAMAKTKEGSTTVEVGVMNYDGTKVAFTSDFSQIENSLATLKYASSSNDAPIQEAANMVKTYTGSMKGRTIIISLNRDTENMKTLVTKYNTTLRENDITFYSISYDTASPKDRIKYERLYTTVKNKLYFFFSSSGNDLLNGLIVDPVMHLATRFLSNHMCKSCYGYCQLNGNDTTELTCKLKSPDDKEAIESTYFVNGCDYGTTTGLVYKIIGGIGMFALVVVALVELLLVLLQRILCGLSRKNATYQTLEINVATQSSLYEAEDNESQNSLFQE
ncbi:hypothetical protein KM1_060850 [Entamoeba histolytica HM-3:IMSS]|uniref:VWFA domain-containing protein n=5 Tax=Entamoeba histolytica TaxID=5759 RepID=C4M1J0_ENTH1|nr:hypothetical protein EHI_001100 [Entamoeba histolytica HM-1:IMSS]EMD45336.1 Hypothetical protein EHI5A_059150 [Entamoeba histolytica KU27]EMS16061.1 hypothetical protein KM1_060850 [Entamoeba histolytica HM-3:IMSS]ENY62413.1 hypothetical protein EHI7A_175180 [Entamoeba histolytica HM-1:IMSS-A]GAT95084.1 hypothetical protein CL6EHI_001100 [Entamoeba histolytica]EAL44491.1 hypothetical protein EHI_001100 [Entamoeba histolytica HM-1:IMSS]|eukprot:XP_649879.1 hypothetical protein EHI_001100 [Entamoeba histolytica HM-1:IMSS]